jgi:hypothetical protein
MGYEIDHGASGQPEVRGDAQDALDASSPRQPHIQDPLPKAHY